MTEIKAPSNENLFSISDAPLKVLHVDNEAAFLKAAKQMLESLGDFQIEIALSVEDALAKVSKESYDVIISDYLMPEKTGLDFLKELREKGITTPFVIFTGKGRKEVVIEALNLGADHYFNKIGEPETVFYELAHGLRQIVTKKKAEEALKESEENYRTLVEAVPNTIIAKLDNKGKLKYINLEMTASITGRLGDDFGNFLERLEEVHPEDYDKVAAAIFEATKGKTIKQIEFRLRHQDGHYVDLLLNAVPLMSEKGEIQELLVVASDVSKLKETEYKLRESKEKYRQILESTPDAIMTYNKNGVITSANLAYEKITGYNREEVIGKKFVDSPGFLKGNSEKLTRIFKEILSGKIITELEIQFKHKNGSINTAVVKPSLTKENGEVVGVQVIVTDITEKKKIEKVLKESNKLTQLLLNATTDAVHLIDEEGIIIELNEAMAKKLKGTRKELIGKNVFDLFPPEQTKHKKEIMGRVISSNKPERVEDSGFDMLFDTSVYPIPSPKGEKKKIAVFARDITERKKAEEALRKAEAKFRYIFENVNDEILLLDKSGKIIDVNKKVEDIFGYQRGEVIGKNIAEMQFFEPENLQKVLTLFDDALKKGGKIIPLLELEIKNKKGKKIPVETSTTVTKKDDEIDGLLIVVRDITERKKTKQALVDSERRYRELVETSLDMIYSLDPKGGFLFTNTTWNERVGFSKEEVEKINGFDLIHPEDSEATFEKFSEILKGKTVENVEFRSKVKDGSYLHVLTNGSPILDSKGNIVAVLGVARDVTEYKNAMKKLERSERKFRIAVENNPDFIVFVSKDGTIFDVNRLEKGFSMDNVIDQNIFNENWYDTKNQALLARKQINHVFQTGELSEYEYSQTSPDGSHSFYETKVASFERDDENNITSVMCVTRDITERVKIGEALKESERRYRKLTETTFDGIVIQKSGKIIEVNKKFASLFGYKPSELIGTDVFNLVTPEWHEQLKKNIVSGDTTPYETVGSRKDGTTFLIEVRPIETEYQGEKATLTAVRDITASRKVETALKRSEEKFRYLLDSAPIGICNIDLEDNITFVNTEFEIITGYNREELLGQNWYNLAREGKVLSDETLNLTAKKAKEKYAGEPEPPYRFRFVRRDRSIRWIEAIAKVIEKDGVPMGLQAVMKDVTDLLNAEELLRNAIVEADILNEKLQVVGEVTRHDIRNSLQTARNYLFLVKQRCSNDHEALEYIDNLESTCDGVERFITFAGDYAKLGIEKLSPVDIGKTIDKAVALYPNINEVEIINECHGWTILSDSMLQQLFHNLIDNSVKHGEKVNTIRLSCKELRKGKINLTYEDDGVGIPKTQKATIFQEAYGKKSGYGLYLIRKMCELYGWFIKETGKPGKGVKFTVTIPKQRK